MNFTPNDIQNILFKKSLIGFNQLQVNDVLEKIVEDFSDLIRENAKMKDKLEDLQDKLKYYKTIENSLQNSLIVAQQTSDEIVANAKKNAENILKEAELNAHKIIDEANKEILGVRFEQERLKREVEAYRARIESVIMSQLKSLQNLREEESSHKAG
jgi:cell division initiation protein